MSYSYDVVNPLPMKLLFFPCESGFPAAKIEAESLSHKNMMHD